MRAGPQLGRVLTGHGLSLDPRSYESRALEVYPHALHVTWFRLGERLRYERKRGMTQQ